LYSSITHANAWGDAANVITFTGNASLHNADLAYTLARSIAVNNSVTATLSGAFGESTNITGAVTGAGDVNINSYSNGYAVTMSHTANTLSGSIWLASGTSSNATLTVNSLADGADSSKRLKMGNGAALADFTLQGSPAAPLIWTNRAVELAGTTGAISIRNNSSQTLTISRDLLFTTVSSGNKTLTLGGSNGTFSDPSHFAGKITNNGISTTAITKTDSGAWSLSDNNSYTGATTVAGGVLIASSLANGGSNSSLGASSNVAGNLILNGGTLRYTGEVVSIDRLFSLQGSSTISASGIGAVNFTNTGSMGFNGGTAAKILTLAGTNTGDNTIAAMIGDNVGATSIGKQGPSVWVLSGANSYTGSTTIYAGVLGVSTLANGGSNSSLGKSSNAAANLVFGAPTSTLRYTGSSDVITDRSFTMSSGVGGGAAIESSGIGSLSFNNTVALAYGTTNETRILTLGGTNTGANTFGKVIANNGSGVTSVTKSGVGTWVLNQTNTYTGATNIGAGTLQLDGSTHASSTVNIGTAGTLSGTGTINGNATLTGNGTINKASGTIGGTLGVTGGNWNGNGAVTGLITSSSGTFTIGNGANLTANGNLNITGGTLTAGNSSSTITGSLNYTSASSSTFAGVIAGTGKTLTLNNSSAVLTLSGDNTFTGATSVLAGKLLIHGSTSASSNFTVNNLATLGGSGTIGGSVTLMSGATLSPGASIESLGTGSNIWNGGSTVQVEFSTDGSTGAAGTEWDLLSITGTLDLTGASSSSPIVLDLVSMLNGTDPGLLAIWNKDANATWAGFVTTTGGITGFAADKFAFDTTQFLNTLNGTFSVSQNGNNLDLNYMTNYVIPEPRAALLGGLGLLLLLRRRR
jgi:fibronectin-binding autotransporter adhesin